jgi:CNT family concentrative nucleoside transporter
MFALTDSAGPALWLSVQSTLGLMSFVALGWVFSEDSSRVPWRTVATGLALQIGMAALLLWAPPVQDLFAGLNRVLLTLEEATRAGTTFVFGYLGGGDPPFEESGPGSSFVLAFRALPLILVVSALSSLLFYWRVLPLMVKGLSRVLEGAMGVGGALGLGTAANVFVGMVEAPLFVRPYLREMSRSELFALVTGGMATIAGTVMVLYASLLRDAVPDALGHILTASLISAPAALLIAVLLVPPEEEGHTTGGVVPAQQARGSMDAITQGTLQGVQLLINIVAMLVVAVALVSLVNLFLELLPNVGGETVTLQRALGWLMALFAWLMGVPWQEATSAGALLGTKTVLNELLAYLDLAALPGDALSGRS